MFIQPIINHMQELESAPSGVVLVSFGTMWIPNDRNMEAILSGLAKLDSIKVIMKASPFNAACNDTLSNATNIIIVPWLPQASTQKGMG